MGGRITVWNKKIKTDGFGVCVESFSESVNLILGTYCTTWCCARKIELNIGARMAGRVRSVECGRLFEAVSN